MKVTVEVDGWNEEKFVDYVVERVIAQFSQRLEKALDEAISENVSAAIARVTDARVDAEVEKLLSEGFRQTDEYGRDLPVQTLRDKVLSYLRKPNQYDSKSLITERIHHAHGREIDKMVTEEIDAARVKFRAEVDGVLKAKFGETLRIALGIKA